MAKRRTGARVCAGGAEGVDISEQSRTAVRPTISSGSTMSVALDRENIAHLRRMQKAEARAPCRCSSRPCAGTGWEAVADPYYGGDDHFDVLGEIVSEGARGLAAALKREKDL